MRVTAPVNVGPPTVGSEPAVDHSVASGSNRLQHRVECRQAGNQHGLFSFLRPALAFTVVLLAALAAVPAQAAPGRPILVGAAEDSAKQGPLGADAKMSLARLAGFNTIRMTSVWWPGNRQVSGTELEGLQNAADAARLNGIRLIISVYPNGSSITPLTPTARAQFAAYAASIPQLVPYVRDVIVGNEPNLNRFWMPQFTATGRGRRRVVVRRAPRPDLRPAEVGLAEDQRDRRDARPTRERQADARTARRIRRRSSSSTWAPPTGAAAARGR